MKKNIFNLIILVLVIIGVAFGISISVKREIPNSVKKNSETKILKMIQTRTADITAFYTYGKAFDLSGCITNVNKDNFESVKLVITDCDQYEETYPLNYSFEDTKLNFSSNVEMNKGIVIDSLKSEKDYYIVLRLKLNNSAEPKYYSFANKSNYQDIDYYTITNSEGNRIANVKFENKKLGKEDYTVLSLALKDITLPQDVYDIVIDAGHGGKDQGERNGKIYEADVVLDYAKKLKTVLEEKGYKVKLTRDDDNTDSYTYSNMYDLNGRITYACESKAKLMISLHVNNESSGKVSGLEIYSPSNSNLDFATTMAKNIVDSSNLVYSSLNSYKKAEGVYVKNFSNKVIKDYESTANKKGYAPYNITTSTPFIYTIREVGGIATGAYVDGRNTDYAPNKYYNSNHGIECYQIELGYIKNDINIIVDEKDTIVSAIADSIKNNY